MYLDTKKFYSGFLPFNFLIIGILFWPRLFNIQSQAHRLRRHPRKRPALGRGIWSTWLETWNKQTMDNSQRKKRRRKAGGEAKTYSNLKVVIHHNHTHTRTFGSSKIVSASAWFMISGRTRWRRQGTRLSVSNIRRQLDKSANRKEEPFDNLSGKTQ